MIVIVWGGDACAFANVCMTVSVRETDRDTDTHRWIHTHIATGEMGQV